MNDREKQKLINNIDGVLGWIDWWLLPWYKKLILKLKGVSAEEWMRNE